MSDAPELSALGSAALHYIGLGYKVFPLRKGRKSPATANGFKDATDDREKVIEWWKAQPDANIGISTGAGLFILDVDRLDGPEGRKSIDNPYLAPLNDRLAELEPESVSVSPSGGYHLWFHTSQAFKSGASDIAEKVDHRCEGGYIVAPPSILDGSDKKDVPGGYRWMERRAARELGELSPLPAEVSGRIGKGKGDPKKEAKSPSLEVINEGGRHQALASEAGRLRNLGLGEAAILAQLREFNRAKCSPPQDDADLVRLARDYSEKDITESWALDVRRASDVPEEPVEWLIEGRIPRGALTTFVGLPGSGKSTFATFIASKVSTGRGLDAPDLPEKWQDRDPAEVLYFAFEDPHGSVVRPRLEEAGADLDRVHLCEVASRGEDERCIDLERDFPLIREKVEAIRPALVIVDPVNSAWSADRDQNDDVDSRAVLHLYKRLARDCGCAIVLITHTNKRTDVSDAQDSASGARAMVGLSRANYLFGAWKDQDGGKEHFMLDLKVNIRAPMQALEFTITGPEKSPRSRVTVVGVRDLDANGFMREKAKRDRADREKKAESKADEARRMVLEVLKESGGAMLSTELEEALTSKGLAKSTVQTALRNLRNEGLEVFTDKERGKNGRSWTYLDGCEPAALREHREHPQHPEAPSDPK